MAIDPWRFQHCMGLGLYMMPKHGGVMMLVESAHCQPCCKLQFILRTPESASDISSKTKKDKNGGPMLLHQQQKWLQKTLPTILQHLVACYSILAGDLKQAGSSSSSTPDVAEAGQVHVLSRQKDRVGADEVCGVAEGLCIIAVINLHMCLMYTSNPQQLVPYPSSVVPVQSLCYCTMVNGNQKLHLHAAVVEFLCQH